MMAYVAKILDTVRSVITRMVITNKIEEWVFFFLSDEILKFDKLKKIIL